jgi:hypothetical protein
MHIRQYLEEARACLPRGNGLLLYALLCDLAAVSPRPGRLLQPNGRPLSRTQLQTLCQCDRRVFNSGLADLLEAGLVVTESERISGAVGAQLERISGASSAQVECFVLPAVASNETEITGSGDSDERLREEKSREEKNKDTPLPPVGGKGVEKKTAPPKVKVPKGDNGFEEFWQFYPRKAKKGDARKAWVALKPDQPLKNKMGRALEALKRSEQWTKDGGRFVPYPASWLRAEGWEDVPPTPKFNYDTMDPFDPDFPDQCEVDEEGWFEDLRLSGLFPEDATFAEWKALPLNTTWDEFRRQRAGQAGEEAGRAD